jgi:hypothetical protein
MRLVRLLRNRKLKISQLPGLKSSQRAGAKKAKSLKAASSPAACLPA